MSQEKYIKDMLENFGMNDAKSVLTPMGTHGHSDLDSSGNMMDQKIYQLMIGSLLHVTASSPNMVFSECMCARFQASLTESHLKEIKRILRYLNHTANVGLWHHKVNRKSTHGTCKLLKRSLVS